MRILVVEDEPSSLKLAHLVLSSDGHEVTQAEAVDQAMDEISKSEPQVILSTWSCRTSTASHWPGISRPIPAGSISSSWR